MKAAIERLLLGDSPAIEAVRCRILKIARAPIPVLIQGQTGVGKELVARALHAASGRSGPLVTVNMCAIAETMFESALFGYVRGAFTGALSDYPGHLVEADSGTLFMDEISGLRLGQQMTLLRALETREFRPIGGRSDRRSNFRLISATNEPLEELIAEGRFRRDFVRRIRGVTIEVPALRERRDDIAVLARHFLRGVCDDSAVSLHLSAGAIEALREHDWPDNVRELKQVIECCALLHDGGPIVGRDLVKQTLDHARRPAAADVAERERSELVQLLEEHKWKVGKVADALNVHRTTVFRRMRHLGIPAAVPRRREPGAVVAGSAHSPSDAEAGVTTIGEGRRPTGYPRLAM